MNFGNFLFVFLEKSENIFKKMRNYLFVFGNLSEDKHKRNKVSKLPTFLETFERST